MSDAVIRLLTPEDAEVCVALRHEMLDESPAAFLASPETDIGLEVERVRERLASGPANVTFGAFAPQLVGSVGMFRDRHPKAAHKMMIWGMYVGPHWRRQGLGRRLVEAALQHARSIEGVTHVALSASDAALEARTLYESLGFRVWGTEPQAMNVLGRYYAEHHMLLEL